MSATPTWQAAPRRCYSAAMLARWCLLVLLLGCLGCSRAEQTIGLKAAFSDETVVGELRPIWTASGEERDSPTGRERRMTLRVDAVNRLSDPVYLRLSNLRLSAGKGPIAPSTATACTLPPGRTEKIVQIDAWVPVGADEHPTIAVDYLAVPLSERGRAFYREFLLQQRPSDAAAIDAEIATYAAAPPCP
jgi:hypothetical protein